MPPRTVSKELNTDLHVKIASNLKVPSLHLDCSSNTVLKYTKMPKASKKSAWEEVQGAQAQTSTQSDVNELSPDEIPSSDQESETEVTFHPFRPQPQVIPSMFMPYIEVPKMDWTVNNGLYHRLLKWHLKCENILECELAAM